MILRDDYGLPYFFNVKTADELRANVEIFKDAPDMLYGLLSSTYSLTYSETREMNIISYYKGSNRDSDKEMLQVCVEAARTLIADSDLSAKKSLSLLDMYKCHLESMPDFDAAFVKSELDELCRKTGYNI